MNSRFHTQSTGPCHGTCWLPVSQSLSWDQVSSSKRAAGCVAPGRGAQERGNNKSYLNHIKIILKKWKTSILETSYVLKLWQFMCGNPIKNSTIPGNTMNGLWISSRNGQMVGVLLGLPHYLHKLGYGAQLSSGYRSNYNCNCTQRWIDYLHGLKARVLHTQMTTVFQGCWFKVDHLKNIDRLWRIWATSQLRVKGPLTLKQKRLLLHGKKRIWLHYSRQWRLKVIFRFLLQVVLASHKP